MTKAIYLHIPFCQKKCHYCDFNSVSIQGQQVMDYLDAVKKEIFLTVGLYPPQKIETIYVGGGTPTILTPNELEYLLNSLIEYFSEWDKDIEFTVEANPGTVEPEKLKVLKKYGVNRISLGVQAFQDQLLSFSGRIHDEKDIYRSIENVLNVGFNNISIDLMYGLPNQTLPMLQESLTKAIKLNLSHYSVYGLKVEEKTRFYDLYKRNQLPLPDEDEELKMYLLIIDEMKKNGYEQYEISNFAKPGSESRHNINYWRNGEYYGFGAGAHGFLANNRYENISGVNQYIKILKEENKLPKANRYYVSTKENMENTIILGLRMLKGISFNDFEKTFNVNLQEKYHQEIDKLTKLGLLNINNKGIRLTKKGIIYGNNVFSEFISI